MPRTPTCVHVVRKHDACRPTPATPHNRLFTVWKRIRGSTRRCHPLGLCGTLLVDGLDVARQWRAGFYSTGVYISTTSFHAHVVRSSAVHFDDRALHLVPQTAHRRSEHSCTRRQTLSAQFCFPCVSRREARVSFCLALGMGHVCPACTLKPSFGSVS